MLVVNHENTSRLEKNCRTYSRTVEAATVIAVEADAGE
jgi:hypothetical protein